MRPQAKSSVLNRLNRIEGQVRGLSRMVSTTAIALTSSPSLRRYARLCAVPKEEILADHVANSVEHAIASGNKAEQRRKVAELMSVLSRAER